MLSATLGNVSLSLEVFSRRFESADLNSFISCYRQALHELVLYPTTREEELEKVIWLDIVRWVAALRVLRVRVLTPKVEFLRRVSQLFSALDTDPWCSYALAFGLSCDECPMVKYGVLKPAKIDVPFANRAFSYCYLFNSAARLVGQCIATMDITSMKRLVRSEINRIPAILIWKAVREEK